MPNRGTRFGRDHLRRIAVWKADVGMWQRGIWQNTTGDGIHSARARDFGEPGVFVAFEETVEELSANVVSLGFDLPALIADNKLVLDHVRVERSEIEETGEYDLEGLFVRLGCAIDSVGAKRVAIDSLEALFAALPTEAILRAELRRLFQWLKMRGLTAVITAEQGRSGNLTRHGLEEYVSDCVIFLDHRVVNQVATRRLRIVKYRAPATGRTSIHH